MKLKCDYCDDLILQSSKRCPKCGKKDPFLMQKTLAAMAYRCRSCQTKIEGPGSCPQCGDWDPVYAIRLYLMEKVEWFISHRLLFVALWFLILILHTFIKFTPIVSISMACVPFILMRWVGPMLERLRSDQWLKQQELKMTPKGHLEKWEG